MAQWADHEIRIIHQQVLANAKRAHRIIDFLCPHFGKTHTLAIYQQIKGKLKPTDIESSSTLLSENHEDSKAYLKEEAYNQDYNEALTIEYLRNHLAANKLNVEEQILFGATCAGQELARQFSSAKGILNLPELIQALSQLIYSGPSDAHYSITSVRPLSDATIHIRILPQLPAWTEAGADMIFMDKVQQSWVNGILDILSPHIKLHRKYSIAHGHSFGLDQFVLPAKHAI